MMLYRDDILECALQWLQADRKIAIATVIETWGFVPCQRGSQLVACSDGKLCGPVSSGCVEAAVVSEALDVVRTRTI